MDPENHINRTPIYHACDSGHLSVVRELYQRGANLFREAEDGTSPFIAAIVTGREDIVEFILQQEGSHAKVDELNSDGDSPLHFAVAVGRGGIIRKLLDISTSGLTRRYVNIEYVIAILKKRGLEPTMACSLWKFQFIPKDWTLQNSYSLMVQSSHIWRTTQTFNNCYTTWNKLR